MFVFPFALHHTQHSPPKKPDVRLISDLFPNGVPAWRYLKSINGEFWPRPRGQIGPALLSEKASNETSTLDRPVAFNGVIVDFGQSIPSSHHYLVKFWVPQAADDALEKKNKTKKHKDACWCFGEEPDPTLDCRPRLYWCSCCVTQEGCDILGISPSMLGCASWLYLDVGKKVRSLSLCMTDGTVPIGKCDYIHSKTCVWQIERRKRIKKEKGQKKNTFRYHTMMQTAISAPQWSAFLHLHHWRAGFLKCGTHH